MSRKKTINLHVSVPTICFFYVSPEQAREWLEGNVINRTLRDKVVARYSEDIVTKNWGVHHQGVAFTRPNVTIKEVLYVEPCLVDGQHRLWAIIEADIGIVLSVCTGLDEHAIKYVDDHLVRDSVDVHNLTRVRQATKRDIAIARMIDQRGRRLREPHKPSRQEQFRLVDLHWDVIQWVTEQLRGRRIRHLTPSPVLAEIARASYTEPREKMEAFIQALVTGANLDEKSPVLHLRNQLLSQGLSSRAARGGAMGPLEQADRTAIAIRAFLDERRLRSLVLGRVPIFTAPGDQVAG